MWVERSHERHALSSYTSWFQVVPQMAPKVMCYDPSGQANLYFGHARPLLAAHGTLDLICKLQRTEAENE